MQPDAEDADGSLTIAQAYSEYTAHMESYFTDPASIVVNSVWDYVDWQTDGTCIWYGNEGWYETWYTQSGWYRQSTNWDNTGGACDWVKSDSYSVEFENDQFCPPATFTYYQYNEIWGYPDGSWYADWQTTKQGQCTNLLSLNVNYGYGD